VKAAPIPADDSLRIAALDLTGLLGTPDEYVLDVVTRIGATLFGTPCCLLSLVDAERQWFKSCVGLDVRQTRRDISFCGYVVAMDAMMVVEDALGDPRFADNPLVLHAPYIRFYAGFPLRAPAGEVLGTLCVIDFMPREFPPQQQTLLRDLAHLAGLSVASRQVSAAQQSLVANLAVARRESLLDPMLRIWNRGGLDALLDAQDKVSTAGGVPFAVLMIDIDLFKMINDNYGHLVGDGVLKTVVRELRSHLRSGDELGRYGGDEFVAVLPNTTADSAAVLARRLNQAVAAVRVQTTAKSRGCVVSIGCTVSIGIADSALCGATGARDVVARADAALLAAKRSGRNRASAARPTASATGEPAEIE
jgi:diguanylate cyclase (GGDEF)-like protein